MRWRLRSDFFHGTPGPYTLAADTKTGRETLTLQVDKDGCFELRDTPATFSLSIFAKAAPAE